MFGRFGIQKIQTQHEDLLGENVSWHHSGDIKKRVAHANNSALGLHGSHFR
jgi:hypothetical protein